METITPAQGAMIMIGVLILTFGVFWLIRGRKRKTNRHTDAGRGMNLTKKER